MNLVLKTSLKNIFGKPLRTLLVLFSIFICSICALVSFEFAASLKELISGSSIGLSKADGILSASDYSVKGLPEGFPESRILEISNKPENLYKDIEGEYAYVTFEKLSVYGMDVKTAVDMDFIEPVEIGLNEAVITTKFAKDYGYKVGDKLMLHDTDNNEVEVTIIGISANERKNPFISNYSAFINEETSENLARGNRKINLVVIDILDNSKAQAAFKNLQEYYPKAIFMNLLADEDMLKQIDEFARFFYMIFAVTFLLVIFVTASICNRIVSERMPFVGTLRSLGMSSARTARILLLENILYALLGCIPAIVIYGILRIPILTFLGGAGSFEQPGTGSFKPLPPFVSAFEADRPSPFAPAKKTASSETPEKETPTPAPRPQSQSERDSHTLRMNQNEIASSTKACPVCGLRALIGEKYCRNCNYQFSNNSVFSRFEEKHINILAILAAIAMAASVFVSFITYTIENASTLAEEVQHVALINKVDGYAFLLLAALALVFGCFGRNKLIVTVGILSVIATVVEDYFLFYDITQVKDGGHIDNELGFYLLAAGAALILISGIYGIVQEKKKQEHLAEQFNMSSMYR